MSWPWYLLLGACVAWAAWRVLAKHPAVRGTQVSPCPAPPLPHRTDRQVARFVAAIERRDAVLADDEALHMAALPLLAEADEVRVQAAEHFEGLRLADEFADRFRLNLRPAVGNGGDLNTDYPRT
jgi:hypothetical protein